MLGIMADLSGSPENPLPSVRERKFIEIDRDNFDHVMTSLQPRLNLRVDNRLDDRTEDISATLVFHQMSDFEPLAIAQQIEPLNQLHQTHVRLKDLMTKLDGNDVLEMMLQEIMANPEKRKALEKELDLMTSSLSKPPIDTKPQE